MPQQVSRATTSKGRQLEQFVNPACLLCLHAWCLVWCSKVKFSGSGGGFGFPLFRLEARSRTVDGRRRPLIGGVDRVLIPFLRTGHRTERDD
eukprot:scaffold3425_cov148-Skeletonema_menzelii.AAC.2